MAYAIIRSGGKQYRVQQGDRIRLEKLAGNPGDSIQLADVLGLGEGEGLNFGTGLAAVEAKVVRQGRGRKIRIWKFKRRKGYARHMGHRQDFTEVEIVSIPTA